MALLSDKNIKKEQVSGKPNAVAELAVSAEQFAAEKAVASAPPKAPVLAPPPASVVTVSAPTSRAPRVRVTEKATISLGGSRCQFAVGDILDSNHFADQRWREILSSVRTEPVTE